MIKVSVVATIFNDEKEIEEFLLSMVNQTYPIDEIVIADGGSSDGIVEAINRFNKKNNIVKLIFGKRLNISEGFNCAINNARNDYILITGVGNEYPSDFLERLVTAMNETDADAVSPIIRGWEKNDFSKSYNSVYLRTGDNSGLYAANHGSLVKKEIFKKYGIFYEKFVYAGEDAEFFEQARKKGMKHQLAEDVYVIWRTPLNWKEFTKQIKGYTIASIQINGLKAVRIEKKKLTAAASMILLILGLFFGSTRDLSCILLISFGLICLIKMAQNGKWKFVLTIARNYLPYYYMIKNMKYFKDEYKVNR